MPSWDEELVTALVRVVQRDLENEAFSRDLWDKIQRRRITRADMRAVVSQHSHIGFYLDQSRWQQRFGFYHPRLRLFLAWSPVWRTEIKTCFRPNEEDEYLPAQEGYQCVWEAR